MISASNLRMWEKGDSMIKMSTAQAVEVLLEMGLDFRHISFNSEHKFWCFWVISKLKKIPGQWVKLGTRHEEE
jgi:hypothetical protein